jgi:hypothetical protein
MRGEGPYTMARIRRDFPMTGIIAMSGGGRIGCDTLLAIAERLGAQHVLQKPWVCEICSVLSTNCYRDRLNRGGYRHARSRRG